MKFSDYQAAAAKTDQFPKRTRQPNKGVDKAELIPLLGLTGEIGALLSEYKKLLRDGPVHGQFRARLEEELGDTLWYVAAVATKFNLSLDAVATTNLAKVNNRWAANRKAEPLDSAFPANERLPRNFKYEFVAVETDTGSPGIEVIDARGRQVGNTLTDNAHVEDGYRFHDVMHFAFVACLGWSPVVRKLLGRKRRSLARKTDEVEDGGRAAVIDEAIVAMIFDYIGHDLAGTDGIKRIDSQTLSGIRALTRGFEVHMRTEAQWEHAILMGLKVWRQVENHGGGTVEGNFKSRSFSFRKQART